MPTAPSLIPPVPTPVPSTDDPGNFDARADATLGALPDVVDGMNAAAENVYDNAEETFTKAAEISAAAMVAADAAGLVGRSLSTLIVGAGVKNVELQAAKPALVVADRQVALLYLPDPSIRMFGTITAITSTADFEVTVPAGGVFGSGSLSDWTVIDAAFFGAAATKEDLWVGESDAAAVAPKTIRDSKVWVPLADAATVTPDGRNGRNFTWTIAGNRLLGAITNCSPNDTYLLEIVQDETGDRDIAWATGVYVRAGGLPALSDAPGATDYLQLRVINVDANGTATRALAQFVRGPTN